MKRKFLRQVAATALAVGVMPALPILTAGQTTPPMGGGYTNVIPIPVDSPRTKAISGALFKPEGVGPFPAVIYMPACDGVDTPVARDFKRRSPTTYSPKASRRSLSTLLPHAVSCTDAAPVTLAPKTPLRR
jgi:hypothetical protein